MTDVSAQEFLDILKDPDMARIKRRVVGMIQNPKTELIEVVVSDFAHDHSEIITTIKIRTYD